FRRPCARRRSALPAKTSGASSASARIMRPARHGPAAPPHKHRLAEQPARPVRLHDCGLCAWTRAAQFPHAGRMPSFKTLDDIAVAGKRVILRADLNVPIKNGKVTDETRIVRLTPTIRELAKKGACVVVLSHFGRPGGQVVPEMSLMPLSAPLSRALGGMKVHFVSDCVGRAAEAAARSLAPGEVLLCENLRFHPEEEQNDVNFARQLAALGDIYVNDAFSAAHRAHASTEAIARLLPAAAGRLMEAELKALTAALEKPKRPLAAVVGGAKISTKLDLLGNLVAKVDHLVIGGGMANTFLNAEGFPVGKSLCEHEMAGVARDVLAKAKARGCTVHLPTDVVVAAEFKAGAP